MASERRIYLLAVAVLAFGLGNSLIKKHVDWLDCFSSRVNSLVDRVSGHAFNGKDRFQGLTERACLRSQRGIERGQQSLVKAQLKMARVQSVMAQPQADAIREQVEKARDLALDRMQQTLIIQQQNVRSLNIPKHRSRMSDDTI
jgi:hypothetical protein